MTPKRWKLDSSINGFFVRDESISIGFDY